MSDLKAQRTEWGIVINLDNNQPDLNFSTIEKRLEQYYEIYTEYWYSIVHDCDVLETGELKTPHLHIVIENINRVRGSTLINRLASFINISKSCISVIPCFDIVKRVQYLTHKNDLDKFQYDKSLVKTNCLERYLILYKEEVKKKLTTEELVDICMTFRTNKEIIQRIGIQNFCQFYKVIESLKKER